MGICRRCKKREATEWFSSSGLAFSHGIKQPWCDRCVSRVQLGHAVKRALVIPKLLFKSVFG